MTARIRISANNKVSLYRKYIKSPTFPNKEAHRKYKTLFNCSQKVADMYYREIIVVQQLNLIIISQILKNSTTNSPKNNIYTNSKAIANTLTNYFSKRKNSNRTFDI